MKKRKWLLLRSIMPYLLLSVFIGFLCNMSVVGLMAASAYLVTSAALHTPLYALALAITGVRACGISRAVFRYAERYISHNAAFAAWRELRFEVYKSVMRALPFSEQTIHSGDVFMTVIEALDELRDAVLRLFLPPLGGFLLTAALFVFLFPYDRTAAGVFAVSFFIITIMVPFIFHPRRKKLLSALQTELYEFIDGASDMAAFGYAGRRAELAQSKIEETAAAEKRSFRSTAAAEMTAQLIAAAAIVFILGIFIESQSAMTGVEAAVLLLVVMAAFEVILPLAGLGGQWQKAADAFARLDLLLQARENKLPSSHLDSPPKENLLTVQELSFSHPGEKLLYKKLDFSLGKGEKTALIGSSGSGKSTIVNLLVRLLAYNSGAVFWKERIYNDIAEEEIREKIRTALQEQYIFDTTIRENFKILYPEINDEEIYAVLQSAGLGDFIEQLPERLDTDIGRDGRYLSGGQRRRLIIALALARKSPLLILDEPTAGLDALSAGEIVETIMKVSAEKNVFVITHDLSRIEKFDRVLILDDGRIAEAGKPADLIKANGLFAEMMCCRNII
ncbi:thiol reductant ABC exporter subunit CydC [Pectinatus haikarae]|uniref:ATP-binding cassette subfamily C protein CydC n=1 Tax=Pectinatus haikarae TaxID=349096 RepID=A0ABT9Y5Z3_9FIRM|nr:thiol reductant ABC exporter subunit CydC [Pectinatus haikarae]MDQ0203252.1 ATP-binding cassette subfamily C protein CydC [Pectinatus haikarae]